MSQHLPWYVFWPRGDRPVRWIPERERFGRAAVVWALMISLAFAARWFFGPDTTGAIPTLGFGLVAFIVVAIWWNARTGEHVTPVELHRRNAVITLATPLWRLVGFYMVQLVAGVTTTLVLMTEHDLDGQTISFLAPALLFALVLLVPVFVAVALWERRNAAELLARTQAA